MLFPRQFCPKTTDNSEGQNARWGSYCLGPGERCQHGDDEVGMDFRGSCEEHYTIWCPNETKRVSVISGASGWTKVSLQREICFPWPLEWCNREVDSCSLQGRTSWPGGKGLLAEVQKLIAPWQGWWTVRYKHQQEMTGLENLNRHTLPAGPEFTPMGVEWATKTMLLL